MFEQHKIGPQLELSGLVTEEGFNQHTRVLFKRRRHTRSGDCDEYNLNHAALGIAGESGEVVDLIKKHIIYGKELDRATLVEEIGDLLFYLDALVDDIGSNWDEVRQVNYDKLRARYPSGYSDQDAIARKDQK